MFSDRDFEGLSIPKINLPSSRAVNLALAGCLSLSLLTACYAPKSEPTSTKTTNSSITDSITPVTTLTKVTDAPLPDSIPLRNRVSLGVQYDMMMPILDSEFFYDFLVSTKSGNIVNYKTRAELLATGEVLPKAVEFTNQKGENISIWQSIGDPISGDYYSISSGPVTLCAQQSQVRDFAYRQVVNEFQFGKQVENDILQSLIGGATPDCWYFLHFGNPNTLPVNK